MARPDDRSSALALGLDLGHPGVSDVSFRSEQTLLDYDVVFWDPAWVLEEYELAGTEYEGRPLLTPSDSARILGDLERRRREMVELLRMGGAIVIFVDQPNPFYRYTGEKEYSGTGRNRHTTNIVDEVRVEDAYPVDVRLVGAAGRKMELRGGEPFASFWREHGDQFSYRAYFDGPIGTSQVVVRRGQQPVAATTRVDKGWLVLLPDFIAEPNERKRASRDRRVTQALLELVGNLRDEAGTARLPSWADKYELPGEQDAITAVSRARSNLERARTRAEQAQQAVTELQQRKLLMAGTGAALERQVQRAFEALGFEVTAGPDGRADLIAHAGDEHAVIEVKGVTKSAKEAHAAQLEKWASAFFEEHGREAKPILVVNTFCQREPAGRTGDDFPHQMRPYAEARRHCLLTGIQLMGLWNKAEADPESVPALRQSLLHCTGVYPEPGTLDAAGVREVEVPQISKASEPKAQ